MTSHTNSKHNNNNIIQLSLSLSHFVIFLLRRFTFAPQSSNQHFPNKTKQQNVMQNHHPCLFDGFIKPPLPPPQNNENEESQIIEGLV